jgi:NitT/TauT family transport system substrate-binding protein
MARSRSTFLATLAMGALAARPRLGRTQTAKVRVGAPVADVYGGPYFIKDAGAFAKIGLDADIVTIPGGAAVAAALAGGSLELGICDLVTVANASLKGVPVEMVAGCGLYRSTEPWQIVGVAKDGPIRAPRDLEGRTIALPQLGGIGLAATRAWLRTVGIDPAKVNFVEFQQSAMTAAVGRGAIDACVIGEPFLVPNRNDLRDIGHPLDAIAKEYLVTGWCTTRAWIEQDRERARRVVAAIVETMRWANGHRPETLAILARESKADVDRLRGMVRTTFATSLDPALIRPVMTIATENKLLDRPVDANTLITKV